MTTESTIDVTGAPPVRSSAWLGVTVKFKTIVADPPWRYKSRMLVTGNCAGYPGKYEDSGTDYPTMSIEEITALPVRELADETGCHLYMWTTKDHLEYSWDIARAWGFVPKQVLVWCKPPKGMIGFGTFSGCTEFVLFAASGERAIHHNRCERTWWEWPRSAHSAKPEAFQDVVESVSPGPYLEMFARRERLGWATWGNEALNHVRLVTPNSR